MVYLKDVTTRWHLIVAAADKGTPGARKAFGQLVGMYWSPVFDFVKDWFGAEEARDLTQAIFTRLLEKNDLGKFVEKNNIRCLLENNELGNSSKSLQNARSRGWFRFWLRIVARNHLIRQRKWEEAEIHGGGIQHVCCHDDLDPEIVGRIEPKHDITPERLYERRLERQRSYEFINRVTESLRNDRAYRKQPEFFDALMKFLTGDTEELLRETAARFHKTPEAMRKAVFDFKVRYRKHLDAALVEFEGGVEHIEEKRRQLREALQSDE